MPFVKSELAATYYGTWLDSYTYDDGTVNRLPASAEKVLEIIDYSPEKDEQALGLSLHSAP